MSGKVGAAFKVAGIQVFVISLMTALLTFFGDVAAYSAWIGGLVFVLANLWFAIRSFVNNKTEAGQVVFSIYLAELEKFSIVIVAMVAIFMTVSPLEPIAVIVGFVIAQITSLVVSPKIFNNH
ncbi:MAG: ATP synthase subunit I [Gammaproteobacteria bacterium]|nr:ATP synthase subunit I [Gammaproteobacteria bacterium]